MDSGRSPQPRDGGPLTAAGSKNQTIFALPVGSRPNLSNAAIAGIVAST
jgi:hypothetical protein